jgi:hypothetical protein
MTRKLKWPYVRENIHYSLIRLTDEEFRKSWFSSTAKHRFWDSLNFYIFDYLHDGPPHLYNSADEMINVALYDQNEATILLEFLEFYHDNFEVDMPDDYYVNHSEWPKLLSEATAIAQLMEANNQKYDYESDRVDYDLEERIEWEKKIGKIIDEVNSWSAEEKQALKDKMANATEEESADVHNEVADKALIAKEAGSN